MNMRNNTAATNRRASTRLFAISVLLALAAILAISSAAPAAVPAAAPAAVPAQVGTMDYDTDDDGYIEVGNLAQLHAIRWDLNGDGDVASGNAANYLAAFVARDTNAATRMGCPGGACVGYEPTTHLDFDSTGDGTVTAADHSGTYWNGGKGWDPIGDATNRYTGNFNGNGKEIRNLFINDSAAGANYKGLFGAVTNRIESLGLTDANVTGYQHVGILVAANYGGTIVACYSTGSASAAHDNAGGLVGWSGNHHHKLLPRIRQLAYESRRSAWRKRRRRLRYKLILHRRSFPHKRLGDKHRRANRRGILRIRNHNQ